MTRPPSPTAFDRLRTSDDLTLPPAPLEAVAAAANSGRPEFASKPCLGSRGPRLRQILLIMRIQFLLNDTQDSSLLDVV